MNSKILTRGEFLTELANLQISCSQINLQIGGVNDVNNADHQTITILDAPPVVLGLITDLRIKGVLAAYMIDISRGGLTIRFPEEAQV